MSGNLFGNAFRVVTFGESHGPFIGVMIDGVKPGLPIDIKSIQAELDRRRPGQSSVVTPREEPDRAQIISGIFEGKTTGTPLCILIKNQDQRSKDYGKLKDILRPGHANYTFLQKYGVFDYRGGGRASGRETATRVAAGAVAKQFLQERNIRIIGYTKQIAHISANNIDYAQIEKNIVRSPDPEAARKMIKAIHQAQKAGDSLGGVIEIVVKNCPPGLGEPVFNKLEADLAQALMSIGAVKAFEIGSGFKAVSMKGSEHNDLFYFDQQENRFRTRTNQAGGVIGGISNGEDLRMRIAVKPPSSINKTQETVNLQKETVQLEIGGRHDPCICPRVVPVAEAMVALVLVDHFLMQERLSIKGTAEQVFEKLDTLHLQIFLMLVQEQKLKQELQALGEKANVKTKRELGKKWLQIANNLGLPLEKAEKLFELILENSSNKWS